MVGFSGDYSLLSAVIPGSLARIRSGKKVKKIISIVKVRKEVGRNSWSLPYNGVMVEKVIYSKWKCCVMYASAYTRERREDIVVWECVSPGCECVWLLE